MRNVNIQSKAISIKAIRNAKVNDYVSRETVQVCEFAVVDGVREAFSACFDANGHIAFVVNKANRVCFIKHNVNDGAIATRECLNFIATEIDIQYALESLTSSQAQS